MVLYLAMACVLLPRTTVTPSLEMMVYAHADFLSQRGGLAWLILK
jgi:hypothetical protein